MPFLHWVGHITITSVWTCIFHVHPHSSARLTFIGEKFSFEKVRVAIFIYFFKMGNKTRKKTLKK